MIHAWVTIEAADWEGRVEEGDGLQKMVSSNYKDVLIAHANVVLNMAGYNGEKKFTVEDYDAMPGEIELGAGLIARLFACRENGVNYYEAREPIGE